MLTLTIPPKHDSLARLSLIGCAVLVCYAAFVSMTAPEQASAQAEQDPIIIVATPALPTPALAEMPGVAIAVSTPEHGWTDQALGAAPTAGDPFAEEQSAALAAEQAVADQVAADQAQYLANVGAQAPHSPRGDNPAQPPAYGTGPVSFPATADQPAMIIDPNVPPADPQLAAAVPALNQEQAAVIGARKSNGCAAGQIFYPRTGCHTPGSGGAMPGAVGTP